MFGVTWKLEFECSAAHDTIYVLHWILFKLSGVCFLLRTCEFVFGCVQSFFLCVSIMPVLRLTLHPRGLPLQEAAKAWYLVVKQKKSLRAVCGEVVNLKGARPSKHAVEDAVRRMKACGKRSVPQTKYNNCGRPCKLQSDQEKRIVSFVKKWRNKRFCTCRYIRQELKLTVGVRTIRRVLNKHGAHWRPVAKKQPLTPAQLAARKVFVEKFGSHGPGWWENNFGLVFDGVTLTKAPKPLHARAKHAAQSIRHMWMWKGERMDPKLHTLNRYGVQLGDKVPLWGGFTGAGKFTLRLWTPKPKMNKAEWAKHAPALRRSTLRTPGALSKIWHDNEGFLLQPPVYRKHGLQSVRFPPCSGDLNPIETVWARLRMDLNEREVDDLQAGRFITATQYRQRAGQILNSYAVPAQGQGHSFLQKLVRGMPRRLARCRANHFGPCGK